MITLGDIERRMEKLKEWALEGNTITKDINFNSFKEAIDFVNKVAELAEKMDHHPTIMISGNTVRLALTTHSEHGLTEKDFDVAEEVDKI